LPIEIKHNKIRLRYFECTAVTITNAMYAVVAYSNAIANTRVFLIREKLDVAVGVVHITVFSILARVVKDLASLYALSFKVQTILVIYYYCDVTIYN